MKCVHKVLATRNWKYLRAVLSMVLLLIHNVLIIIIVIIIINKPDIIIRDNKKGTCVLTDVAISKHRSVIKKEAEKIIKYKDLTIEIQLM